MQIIKARPKVPAHIDMAIASAVANTNSSSITANIMPVIRRSLVIITIQFPSGLSQTIVQCASHPYFARQ